jgi:hypothetical protein
MSRAPLPIGPRKHLHTHREDQRQGQVCPLSEPELDRARLPGGTRLSVTYQARYDGGQNEQNLPSSTDHVPCVALLPSVYVVAPDASNTCRALSPYRIGAVVTARAMSPGSTTCPLLNGSITACPSAAR